MTIPKFWRNSSIKAMVIIGLGGVGFSLGNVLLARGLDPAEYATFALVLAFSQLSYAFGPLGVDTIVNRYTVNADRPLLLRILLSSLIVSLGISAMALIFYDFRASTALVLVFFAALISINRVAAALYRSHHRYRRSLLMVQSHNMLILGVAIFDLFFDIHSALIPCIILTVAYAGSAAWGWRQLFLDQPVEGATPSDRLPWREGMAIIGISTAVVVLIQLDRLAIPKLLHVEALATYAVLAAIAGSPFRVLQMGVGFTLVPRLRASPDRHARQKLIAAEAVIVTVILIASVLAVWFVTPLIVDWLLRGKYFLDAPLIAAALFAGIAKVIGGFGSAIVTAIGNSADISKLSWFSWLGLAAGCLGAWVGANWGLTGIIYGVSCGWIVEILATFFIAVPHILTKKPISAS